MRLKKSFIGLACGVVTVAGTASVGRAQLRDVFQAPNPINEGIHKTFAAEIGAGRGDVLTPGSSLFIIGRDPFRAVRRGRQVFQRKFLLRDGLWDDQRQGNIAGDPNIGAGLADSCAGCHGRPRGSAGHGGNTFTRPDSRDARHLFGLGLQEMLADEITAELRAIRADAVATARSTHMAQTVGVFSKGISYGELTARPNGTVNLSGLDGIDADLRVRPFFAQGAAISIREMVVGELEAEMGLEAPDTDLLSASRGGRITTPSGMVLDGRVDRFPAPPVASAAQDGDGDGKTNEIPLAIVDYLESYLLNSFAPAIGNAPVLEAQLGRAIFTQIGCASCHVPNLEIDRDRRIVDVQTAFDPVNGGPFNGLFASVTSLVAVPAVASVADRASLPPLQPPAAGGFLVRNIFTDLKRHDVGPAFYERNFDGSLQKTFMTTPLWGVATTAPYGHDGRSATIEQAILRHGGDAQFPRDVYASLTRDNQLWVLDFLSTLQLFPPEDTASTFQPADPTAANFPQNGHGAISLTSLFVNPRDLE
jgi:mono/diheme cytochrome c family protein